MTKFITIEQCNSEYNKTQTRLVVGLYINQRDMFTTRRAGRTNNRPYYSVVCGQRYPPHSLPASPLPLPPCPRLAAAWVAGGRQGAYYTLV